jgi:cytochrome P450 family 2 subfamily J
MKFIPGPHQTLFSNWEKLKLFVSQIIEQHKRDWNPDKTRDFIDAYLKEMEKVREKEFPLFYSYRTKSNVSVSSCSYKVPQV